MSEIKCDITAAIADLQKLQGSFDILSSSASQLTQHVKNLIAVLEKHIDLYPDIVELDPDPPQEPEPEKVIPASESPTNPPTIQDAKEAHKSKRPNKFLDSPLFDAHKEDVEIDKKLANSDYQRVPRPPNLISVKCSKCGKQFEVAPHTVYQEKGEIRGAICDKCLGRP